MSSFSPGQVRQVMNSIGRYFTAENLTQLGQAGEEKLKTIIAYLESRAILFPVGGGSGEKKTLTPFATIRIGFFKKRDVDFVCLDPKDLALPGVLNPSHYRYYSRAFCAKWSKRHLDGCVIEPCHRFDAYRLLRQWKGQQKDTTFAMAMEPVDKGWDGPHPGSLDYSHILHCDVDGERFVFRIDDDYVLKEKFIVYRFRKI